jgi:predicted nucleic acid-binding protein
MSDFLDSSVLVASLDPDEAHHAACDHLLRSSAGRIYVHAIAETFSTLTGGRRRVSPLLAMQLLEESIVPFVKSISLSSAEMLTAMKACQNRGIRGGAIYDYLHLVAARKAKASRLYTLNLRDFQAIHRAGDPDIVLP